jgi:PAS domain S-box-containing protein
MDAITGINPAFSAINSYNLFMQAPAMICIMEGRAGKCILSNPLFTKLFGGRDLLGKTPREVAPELEGQGYFEMLENVYDTGIPVYRNEYPGIADWNDDGNLFQKYFNFVYAPYEVDGAKAGVMIFGFEVSQQVEASRKIMESERKFQELANSIPQIVWTAKPDGFIDYYNKQWYNFTGFDESFGDESWIPILHPDDLEYCLETWYNSVRSGQPYEIEYRFRDRINGGYRWFLGRALPLKNEKAEVIKWLGTCTDIEEAKNVSSRLEASALKRTKELERVNNLLQQSNHDLEQFAYVASHDLKEPLRKIRLFSEKLQHDHGDGFSDEAKDLITRIDSSVARMNQLIDGLLKYSAFQTTEEQKLPVNLNTLITEVIADLDLLIAESDAQIRVEPLPDVFGYKTLLLQLFYNLLLNALKFTRPGHTPVIHLSSSLVSAADYNTYTELVPHISYTSVALQDNGIGFSKEEAVRIFDPFVRLHSKNKYEGTGLGLSFCKKIVERHRGHIIAEGNVEEGACFRVFLPVKEF